MHYAAMRQSTNIPLARRAVSPNGNKVSPESESYEECLFGYSCIVHTDICTFILVFSHGIKSRAGQGAA